jgi:hypothetical protein
MFMASDGTATAGADHDIRLALLKLGLGNFHGSIKVFVGQGRVQDGVAVVLQVGRLQAARCRLPAVEKEDSHGALPLSSSSYPGL